MTVARLWPAFLTKLDVIWARRSAAVEAARQQASLNTVSSLSAIALDSLKVCHGLP